MTGMNVTLLHLVILAMTPGLLSGAAATQTRPATTPATLPTTLRAPDVTIKVVTEDKQKQIQATVTLNGKPLENVTVSFFVKRRFGNMSLGQDKTLDDGTADVPFPLKLPAGPTGRLEVFATTPASAQYAAGRGQASLEGAPVVAAETEDFPRALWAPRAPALLVVTILAILVAVWACYLYAIAQLVHIARKR